MITREQAAEDLGAFETRCPACGRLGYYVEDGGYSCGCRYAACTVCGLMASVTPTPRFPDALEWCECGDSISDDDQRQSAALAIARRGLRGETTEDELTDAFLLVCRALVDGSEE
jgi:hypothetical protein